MAASCLTTWCDPMDGYSWLDRAALAVFSKRIMWMCFFAFNVFLVGYIEIQEHSLHPFDAYPFEFLNLVLAIFSGEMAIIIVLAQIISSFKTDLMVKNTATNSMLLVESMEGTLVTMRALEDMGKRESERDAELHALIKEGQGRLVVMERLLRELIEDREP